jgi:3-oxoacyl-[acyl-carrier-protein] synthase-3
MGSKIVGVGMYAPPQIVTNKDFEKMVQTSDEWIRERTGMVERHKAAPGTPTSDLAAEAARRAMSNAGLSPDDIDIIIVASLTPDMLFPSTSCYVQSKIKAKNAFAFDIMAACSGFIFALSMADAMIRAGRGKNALVIGAEIMSSILDYTDRNSCILFGDGAGAAVLSDCPEGEGILSTHTHSDGDLWTLLNGPGGGTVGAGTDHGHDAPRRVINMSGNDVYKHAVTRMAEVSEEALKANGVGIDDVALFIPHQANLRIIKSVGKRIHIPAERVFVNLAKYGNTSAASIPMALAEAYEQKRYKPGDLVLMSAFGGGLTWGSALVRM